MNKSLLSLATALALASPARAFAYKLPDAAPPVAGDSTLSTLQAISRGVAKIASDSSRGVVLVSTSAGRGREGLGSGFIVDLAEGYVITNNHVVEGARDINLKLPNGESYAGHVVGRDEKTDVAVVQIMPRDFKRDGLSALALADSDKTGVGDLVVALGSPFGLEASVSFGVVSAVGRGNLNITELGDFIQTDAAINPGNSGGPLLNAEGQVVGMNTAIFSKSGAYNGIGFSVPSKLVREIADRLIGGDKMERGYLGVQLQELTGDVADGLHLPAAVHGGLVAEIDARGPANAAGLESGDVISEVDGQPLKNATALVNVIGLMAPGRQVKLTYYRNGDVRSTSVRLGAFPTKRS